MATLIETLVGLLESGPGQFSDELYERVVELGHRVQNARAVEAALRRASSTFVQAEEGSWTLVTATATAAPTDLIKERTPLPNMDAGDLPSTLEWELRARLRGRRVVAEIGLDARTHEQVEAALEELLRRKSVTPTARSYPALFATYLVGHGVYRFAAGAFWPSLPLPIEQQTGGPAFMEALRALNLESFNDMVVGDNALTYVAPILAHGGVPKYCLEDYFSLVLRDMERVGGDASQLLSYWRTRKTAFLGIDTPVRRFLLFGGDIACDVLDRTMDLVREHARAGKVPKPADVGLPPYIVTAFRNRENNLPSVNARRRTESPRPRIILDPWSTDGPQLVLPAVFTEDAAHWRLLADGILDRIPATRHDSREIQLSPAKSWTVELRTSAESLGEAMLEGLDEIPALFFDPSSGELVSSGSGLRLSEAWIVGTSDAAVQGVNESGELVEMESLQQLPPLTGEWSGFQARHVALAGVRAISVSGGSSGKERRISVRPPAERASISVAAIPNVTTIDGLAVFESLPTIEIPSTSALDLDEWRARVLVDGEWHPIAIDNFSIGLDSVVTVTNPTRLTVVVQGPLGADLRSTLVYVPGLSVKLPTRLVFPGERAVVTVAVGDLSQDLVLADREDHIEFVVGNGPQALTLHAAVPKLVWGVRWPETPDVVFADAPVSVAIDEMGGHEAARLMVRTGVETLELEFKLLLDGAEAQTSGRVQTKTGRWALDLSVFADTVARSEASRAELVVEVGGRRVPLVRVRRSFYVDNVTTHATVAGDHTRVDFEFTEGRPIRNRVVRVWSRDRAWAEPIEERIADDQVGNVSISRYDALPPGRYLAEFAVDDGWVSPQRPRLGKPGTIEFTVGTPDDVRDRLDRLSLLEPLNVAEIAAATGLIARVLDPKELAEVVPALLETMAMMLDDAGGHEVSSQRFMGVRALVGAESACLAEALVGAVELGRLPVRLLLPLSIVLAGRLKPVANPAATSFSDDLSALWEIAPAIAACLDVQFAPVTAQFDRYRQFLGFDPADGLASIATGEPVHQMFIGMEADTLEHIGRMAGLVPKTLFDLDSLVEANFEWLAAAKANAHVERWWNSSHRLISTVARFDALELHLAAREAPKGTAPWAGVPAVTLAAAVHLLTRSIEDIEATRALLEAATFAPRLVTRDLVLARVLLTISGYYESTESE